MATTTHPGVTLWQRLKGGVFYIRWFAPPDKIQRNTTTEATDFGDATTIAEQVSSYMRTPSYLDDPPEGWRKRTYEIIGVYPHSHSVNAAQQVLEQKPWNADDLELRMPSDSNEYVHPYPKGFKVLGVTEEKLKELLKLPSLVESLRIRLDDYKRRATTAEARLRAMDKRVDADAEKLIGLTLQAAREAWEPTLKGDDDYVQEQKWACGMFVKKFKPDTLAASMAGREKAIFQWIDGLTTERKDGEGKMKERRLGASRRSEIRRVCIKFLTDTGVDIARKAIGRPSRREIRRDRGAIKWLNATQAKAEAEALTDLYWNDAWRIQVATGMRPDELITLKDSDFINDYSLVTLAPLGSLTLKLGSRTVPIPEAIRHIIKRRVAENKTLFPYHGRKKTRQGKPWQDAKHFDRLYNKALNAAAPGAGISFKMDCRIGRRTCATLLLGAGVPPKAVADMLGDNLATILEHYAAAIPASHDSTQAVIA